MVEGVQRGADMEVEIVDALLSKLAYSNLEDINVLKPNEETSPPPLVELGLRQPIKDLKMMKTTF